MSAQESIGLIGPEYDVEIERGKIREFARAMHAELPEFLEESLPTIPATYLVSAPYIWGYSLERPRGTIFSTIDHDLSVPLHAEEEFIFLAPPPKAGDKLTAYSILEDVREKNGGGGGTLTFLTVLTVYKDQISGEKVVEQRSTTVTTGQAPGEANRAVDLPELVPSYWALDPVDPFSEIKRAIWDDLHEGTGPGVIDAGPLSLRDIVRFQGVVGEDNPLHHDIPWAHSFKYPTVFGLGTHQASVLAGYAAHWVGADVVRKFKVRFCDVYWPGDILLYEGTVARKYLEEDTGRRLVDLELQCRRETGEVLVRAWITCSFGEGVT